jgi:tetratricopeptide (TPR) repeat protein
MQRAVKKSRRTLAVLTPNYVKSSWAGIENVMVQTLDPDNRNLRLIPLLRAKCKVPLSIKSLTHIDFTDGADLDLAWRQLLTALGAPPEQPPPEQPKRDHWFLAHPYPMPPNFTGRLAERAMLSSWLAADVPNRLLLVQALGGFGKSALTWHWLMHDVDPKDWPRVIWWSFYEGDASFDSFLANTVQHLLGGRVNAQSLSARDQLVTLLQMLHQPGTLLVLDGFERALRAFGGLGAAYQGNSAGSGASERDCISPLAEVFLRNVCLLPGIRSKVLLTTRLRPQTVEARGGWLIQGAREEILRQMDAADAVVLFQTQGIRGTRAEIDQACRPYGYHPLSLRLLAGLIVGDLQQPGDIAAAKRLDVSGDLVQRQHHVLEAAYDRLTPACKMLLNRIACFRSPEAYEAFRALADTPENGTGLDADLRDLVSRGLLHHDTKEGRFDLHPIVRRYAYDRLAAPDRAASHTLLRDYFAAVPKPDKVTRLEDLAPVIELYHHTLRAGQYDEARELFRDRISDAAYFQLGAYQLQTELLLGLFPDGEDRPPRLKDESHQSWTLNSLANSYSVSGQPQRAVPLYERNNAISERLGDKTNLAVGLGNLAQEQVPVGSIRAAEANLRRSVALCVDVDDEFWEAAGHSYLGWLLACRGERLESESELSAAIGAFDRLNATQYLGLTCAYRALLALLMLRSQSSAPAPHSPLESARRALELADETARTKYPYERDYVRAHWLLGAAYRADGQLDQAERHLNEALERCRRINLVEAEADILIDLARLRAATGAPDEAQRLAEEAVLITERSGYVLRGADAHLELAKLALARGDTAKALKHAREARRLATCDGPPDYTYKVAYDEAGALIEQLR